MRLGQGSGIPRIFTAALALGGVLVLGTLASVLLPPDTAHAPGEPATATSVSTRQSTATPTSVPSTPTPVSRTGIYLDEGVPHVLRTLVTAWAATQKLEVAPGVEQAALSVTTRPRAGARLLAERVYVPVAWFPALRGALTLAGLRDVWQGKSATALYVSDDTAAAL